MTIEEFEKIEPVLANRLRWFAHGQVIDGVYRDEDAGRWTAHITTIDGTDIALEGRCRQHCFDFSFRPRAWVWENHVCCAKCEADPNHYYETVHE